MELRLKGAVIGSNLLATSDGGNIGPMAFGAIIDATDSYKAVWILGAIVVLTGVRCTAIGLKEKLQAGKGPHAKLSRLMTLMNFTSCSAITSLTSS